MCATPPRAPSTFLSTTYYLLLTTCYLLLTTDYQLLTSACAEYIHLCHTVRPLLPRWRAWLGVGFGLGLELGLGLG